MPEFSAYSALPPFDQLLHNFHVLLCALAVLIAIIPLMTAKGSAEHKFGGLIYVPVSFAALALGCVLAGIEGSVVLLCFEGFCAYLLLSGWRAVHEQSQLQPIDWMIPGGLILLAGGITLYGLFGPAMDLRRSFCLSFFAFNSYFLAWRDWGRLRRHSLSRHNQFLTGQFSQQAEQDGWLGRHIAGMAGSMLANLSVVVLTLLPLDLHWLWPASLMLLSLLVAIYDRHKKRHVRRAMAQILQPKFQPKPRGGIDNDGEDIRRAA
jgi:hypothetical protein